MIKQSIITGLLETEATNTQIQEIKPRDTDQPKIKKQAIKHKYQKNETKRPKQNSDRNMGKLEETEKRKKYPDTCS